MKKWLLAASALSLSLAWSGVSSAAVSEAETALAKESEKYCKSTATKPPAVKTIMDKVKEAVTLLKKEGSKAFPKFKGKDSAFIFNGTYLWIHTMDGKMLMHPLKPDMVGQEILKIKDADGTQFFSQMNDVVKEKDQGWVSYKWPKPGEKESSVKVSYVHSATIDDQKVVVGCGVYNLTLEDVEAALKKSAD